MSLALNISELTTFFCDFIRSEKESETPNSELMQSPLHEAGLDSLALIEMFLFAEEEFIIHIDIEVIPQDASLQSICDDILRIHRGALD